MNSNPLLNELNNILSETRNPSTLNIDLLSTEAILKKINELGTTVILDIGIKFMSGNDQCTNAIMIAIMKA